LILGRVLLPKGGCAFSQTLLATVLRKPSAAVFATL
jgi:hypothetical protein